MDTTCRLCGLSSSKLVPLFSFYNGRIISDLITLLIPIIIKMDEMQIPNNICKECVQIIGKMHDLRKKSIKNDSIFRSSIKNDDPVKKEEVIETSRNESRQSIEDSVSAISVAMDNNDNDSDWSLPDPEQPSNNDGTEKENFKCDLCNESFLFLSNLARHHRQYHKNTSNKFKYYMKPVNCTVCGILIPQQTNLKRHMIQYHDNNHQYGCPQCTYRFSNLASLKHHGIKFHNVVDISPKQEESSDQICIFECDICANKFVDRNSMLIHMHRRHLRRPNTDDSGFATKAQFHCQYCDREFTVRSNMFRHYQHAHSQELPFQCEQCKEGFRTERLYIKHMEKIHMVENFNKYTNPESRAPVSTEPLICEFCSEDCSNSRYRYERHLIIMHEDDLQQIFECQTCRKKFFFKDSWDQHNAWHERKSLEKTYEHVCDMCGKRFPSEERLEKHKVGYHAGQSSLVCHICGKQMRNKSSLNFHVKRHSEKRDFACPQCPQSFVYIKELERHMSSHIDNRKYVCTFEGCTKRFNDLYIFQLHKKRHLGLLERKYHCEYCEKRFTSKYALDRHVLTHTQQRPHVCEYCSMAYTQRNDLIKHLREHVGDAIYKCDFEGCTEGFRLKFELKQHYAVHYVN
ncbi:unnamed protein product [Chironomus riparius]|uniref:Uncharacterized protein n=1 Tax=Chironomus riparius TaxID=315576 RepID=A0A9N9RX53_9DIPT|nr:unnamed protein product [Chironomus riparius]